MKYDYKGLLGIPALRKKRQDEKALKKQCKPWKQRQGIVSQLCEEQGNSGNRQDRRRQAKLFIKNPLGLGHV